MIVLTPDWGTTGEAATWRPLLDRLAKIRVPFPDGVRGGGRGFGAVSPTAIAVSAGGFTLPACLWTEPRVGTG